MLKPAMSAMARAGCALIVSMATLTCSAYGEDSPTRSVESALPSHIPIVALHQLEARIPPPAEKAIQKKIDKLTGSVRESFAIWLSRSGKYVSIMQEILEEKGLPRDLVFLPLIESGFDPLAVSSRSATGPWQFMAGTAKTYGLTINWWTDERRDPIKATVAAADYLKRLYEMFGSWPLALASYNAGEGRVSRALAKSDSDDFWGLMQTKLLPKQTRDYVPLFMAATLIARDPERHGFKPAVEAAFEFDEVILEEGISLYVAAKCADTTVERLRELNPALKRNVTPPYPNYILRIPPGTKDAFRTALAQLPDEERLAWDKVKIKKGDTLWVLAKKHNITVSALKEVNSMEGSSRLTPGDYVLVPKDYPTRTVRRQSESVPKG